MDIKELNEALGKFLNPIYFEARNYSFIKDHPNDFYTEENKAKYLKPQTFGDKDAFFSFLDSYIEEAGNVDANNKEELARFLYGHEGHCGNDNLSALYDEYIEKQ